MIYELIAYNTDSRYWDDVRYREYTTNRKKAEAFKNIPRIQFTDSGHGIEFTYRIHVGSRKPTNYYLRDYVRNNLIKNKKKNNKNLIEP